VEPAELTQVNVVDRLVDTVPEFGGVLAEHLAKNDGEPRPHPLFVDLARFVLEAVGRDNIQLTARTLGFLDRALRSGDEYVQQLVMVSFVENVAPWDRDMAPFLAIWPLRLRACARALGEARR
jgi:hypothetical protein